MSTALTARADCVHLDPERRTARAPMRRLAWVLALTGVFLVIEAVGGWLSGSLALLADAGHALGDVAALALTLLTAWIAERPATATKTYGYLRWEILAALVNGAALFGIAAWVVVEAIHRLGAPPQIRSGLFATVALAGLLINIVSLRLLHGSHGGGLNARAAYLHVIGDLLGSAGALAAALVIHFTGWMLADPIISVALALLILVGAWRLVRESTDVLLEAVPRDIAMAEVQRRMLEVTGVRAVHDLHVWTVTSGMVAMSGHAIVPDLAMHPRVLERIREALGELGIGHVTIQLEVRDECEEVVPVTTDAHAGHSHQGHAHHH